MTQTPEQLLAETCRVSLAGLIHDLGKFSERARLFDGAEHQSALEAHKTQFCPFYKDIGRHTHVHAAYTGMTYDLLSAQTDADKKPIWPDVTSTDNAFPFTPQQRNLGQGMSHQQRQSADDSLVSASAMHHKPDTFLQWIIATADRIASGFEREAFDDYNREAGEQTDHYRARLWSLLEQIQLTPVAGKTAPHQTRYPLAPYSPASLMPTATDASDKTSAQAEYRQLWDGFMQSLAEIPASHRHSLPLWLDHFDTLWLTYTHAIPSSTFNTKADVSLYDHSKTTSALATALWRYYAEQPNYHDKAQQQAWASQLRERANFDDNQLLLIQGDFAGIQDFLFANGGSATKNAAKLLRGRSFYVSLLCELAALKLLDALSLPSTSQIINAAGKFMILAPATANTIKQVQAVERELNAWFLAHSFGEAAIVLAVRQTSPNDLMGGNFSALMQDLFAQLDEAKLKRFNLLNDDTPSAVFSESLSAYRNDMGVCDISGKHPAQMPFDGMNVSQLARDQMICGKHLANPKRQRILITTQALDAKKEDGLVLPIFGYHVTFTDQQGDWTDDGKLTGTGKFGDLARSGVIKRFWDISLPTQADSALWNGYARRYINAYVPVWQEAHLQDADWGKYNKLGKEEQPNEVDVKQRLIKTLNHLACENRTLVERPISQSDSKLVWQGQTALMTLKGDVDNLGAIFQSGMKTPSFAKMASLSRQINAFFAIYLPWLCQKDFPNTYTVFAGGDDFFLIGAWKDTVELANRMQSDFARFCSHNPDLHFSAGMVMSKPGVPIHTLAEQAETGLEQAKGIDAGKNAVTLWQNQMKWQTLTELLSASKLLDDLYQEHNISMGYRYGLLNLADKAASTKPEDAIWRAHLIYRTQRYVIDKLKKGSDADKQVLFDRLTKQLYGGLNQHKQAFKVALFAHLYQYRD